MPDTNTPAVYKTKQRALVLEYFRNNEGLHLTIDDICQGLKDDGTPVGKTTVYRYVQKLADEGIVTKYSLDNESSCYQYHGENKTQHFHLKCTVCMELFHASCEFMESVDGHIFHHHGFKVDSSKTVFYGVCQNCLRNRKKTFKKDS